MKCYNCKTNIDSKFAHAISQNMCPACGKDIMSPEKIASYNSLQQLVSKNFPNVNSEKLANLIVANFELKQLFKEETIDGETEMVSVEATEEAGGEEKGFDALYKKRQMEEARKTIREQEYEQALARQYGLAEVDPDDMMEPDSFFGAEEEKNPIVLVNKLKEEQKKAQSYDNMMSGSGFVRRSS